MTRLTVFFTDFSLMIEDVESLVASTTLSSEDAKSCGCGDFSETPIKDDVTPVGEEPQAPVRWKGILGVEGELTGDGRFIQPGALRWENLPIPLRYVSADVGAHQGAVVVGRIDKIERDEETGLILGEGDFDMGSAVGREAMRQVKEDLMRGVSMDLDDVAFEVRIAADAPALMAQDPVKLVSEGEPDEDGRVKVQEMAPDDEVMVTTDARVRAATIVAVPAFSRAMLGMAEQVDEVFEEGAEESLVASISLRVGGVSFEVEYDAASIETFNWVEDVGGLPEYIDKIADAIRRKNPEMSEGHTIAIAVNAVKKMCATGDINFPGDQDVNPGSRAQACAAVTEWEEKKARAKADSSTVVVFGYDEGQWRNPDNGRWIDMPHTAIQKITDAIEGLDDWQPSEENKKSLGGIMDAMRGIGPNNADPDSPEYKSKVADALKAAEAANQDDTLPDPVLAAINDAIYAMNEFEENYVPEEESDLTKDEDTDIDAEPKGAISQAKAEQEADPESGLDIPESAQDPFPESEIPEGWSKGEPEGSPDDPYYDDTPYIMADDEERYGEHGLIAYNPENGGYFVPGANEEADVWGPFETLDEAIAAVEAEAQAAEEAADEEYVLKAAAAPHDPDMPSVHQFSNPNLKEPTPLTVTEDGRVYGHLATWGTCHLTHTAQGKCVVPPKTRTNYAYFHTGSVLTKEGAEIAVGQITLNTRHAADKFKPTQALAHYDNTGLAVADVVAGEDAHGIWISGALRPGVTAKAVRVLRASPLSGDWRRVGGNLELVAALAVNVPGFPVPRPHGRVSDGRMNTLVAAGMLPPRRVRRPGTKGALSADDLRYLKRLAARERQQEQEEKMQTLAAVDSMAKRLRSTEKDKVLAAARRIKVQQMAARIRAGA